MAKHELVVYADSTRSLITIVVGQWRLPRAFERALDEDSKLGFISAMTRLLGFAAACLLLFGSVGCLNTIRPTSMTEDEVSLTYDTLMNSWDSVQERANELCQGRAVVMRKWDNIGTRGATFRCDKR